MNGTSKFRKATSPAFAPGEKWKSVSGNIRCTIVSVEKYQPHLEDHSSNYRVTYEYEDGRQCEKDAWNFQVRYEHVADTFEQKEYGRR